MNRPVKHYSFDNVLLSVYKSMYAQILLARHIIKRPIMLLELLDDVALWLQDIILNCHIHFNVITSTASTMPHFRIYLNFASLH